MSAYNSAGLLITVPLIIAVQNNSSPLSAICAGVPSICSAVCHLTGPFVSLMRFSDNGYHRQRITGIATFCPQVVCWVITPKHLLMNKVFKFRSCPSDFQVPMKPALVSLWK